MSGGAQSQPPVRWRTAWVTGASSGIGKEVALQLARSGARVAISARSAETLAAVAAEHPGLAAYPLDVSDKSAVTETTARIWQDFGGIDLAILNAGVWHPMSAPQFDAERIVQSMQVNFFGVAYPTGELIKRMSVDRRGHIALVSSVAGYRGLPKAIAYGPSKAAVISFAEALKVDCDRLGIDVSLINPGFVATPMTSVNDFPMPFLMQPADAAAAMIRGLERRRFEIAFPWQLVALLKFARLLPYPAFFWYVRNVVDRRKTADPNGGAADRLS